MKRIVIPPLPKYDFMKKKRVAAYCRVSTQQDIQYHSLETQVQYFEKKILSTPYWEYVGVFADQVSGRCNQKMTRFQEMLKLCFEGGIDLILVKSISRLGRNTVEFLQVCDRLNQIGVEVYFEVENLYISDPKAVRMLTIYASLYQNESEVKSGSVKWGLKVGYMNGTSKLGDRPCYGYRRNADGALVPHPEEAENVRMIYRWRKLGLTLREISAYLTMASIKAPGGENIWSLGTIQRILTNEKYKGDVLLQKTYVADYFTGSRRTNQGEYEQYYVEGHHEPILDD